MSIDTAHAYRRHRIWTTCAVILGLALLRPGAAAASDTVYFSQSTNVTDILVQYINQETVRLDISSWYLSEHAISIAIANRWAAGVPVRIIGDRAAIFEDDPNTKKEFYWLASQGVPIRLRFNPTYFPELDHWKAAIFVGQNTVEFGSGNFAPTELAPVSSTNFDDESEMFTTDPAIVGAFKTRFDVMWNDTTVEPNSIYSPGPPYLKNWDDACASEPTGGCSDYHTQYPNPVPMTIDTARLEPDNPTPPDLYWGQGSGFNDRLTQEIENESSQVDLVIYRLEVDNITQALLDRHQAGVDVRVIVDPAQYTNATWPEYWLTHANMDKLYVAGVPIEQRAHAGVTHMKTLVTSTYATNGSSNYVPNWQRDHDYFVSAATKPAIYQAFVNQFQQMWADTTNFAPFTPTPPDPPDLVTPTSGAANVATNTPLTWKAAPFATSYDVYFGTSENNLPLVVNVPAQLVTNPPSTYSWTPTSALQPSTTYFWRVVSRTLVTPVDPSMVASSSNWDFTTSSTSGLPSPWQSQDVGAVGLAGSATGSGGQFTVSGAGANIWGTADSFQYVYQPLSGDGQIVARVTGVQNTNAFAKAGVMLRETLDPGSAHVVLDVRPDGSVEFMSRATTGGPTTYLAGTSVALPGWVELVRTGTSVAGYTSTDGATWTLVGTTTLSIATNALVGLPVTSADTSQLNTSTFDSVAVTPGNVTAPPTTPNTPSPADGVGSVSTNPTLVWTSSGATRYTVNFGTSNPPPQAATGLTSPAYAPGALAAGTAYFWQVIATNSVGSTNGPVWTFTTATSSLPSPWQSQDIGAVGLAGSAAGSGGQFTVSGAGANIWGTADSFQYVYQPLSGDGQIVARVTGVQNTNTFAKAGVMLRETFDPGSAHVVLDVRPDGSVEFMSRATTGGSTTYLAGTSVVVPGWLELVRSGTSVAGYTSTDGATWTLVGTTTLSIATNALVGLPVTSADTSQLNTSTFDNVAVTPDNATAPPTTPNTPSPADGAGSVSTNPTLAWVSSGATTFDVSFGTANPPPQVSTGRASASYAPSGLSASTTYFWQIVARNSAGTTSGPVWSFTTGAQTTSPKIVIYASDISTAALHGTWAVASDSTSPNGVKLVTPDNGQSCTANPLAAPASYVDVTFNADAGTPYTLWLRMQATANSKYNDSLWVQFSDARANGSSIYPINSTSGLDVNLATDSTASSLDGWGWQNTAYWLSQPTTVTFATSGAHTMRIQVREDGAQFDQIVLSSSQYLSVAPGGPTNDSTIVPKP